MAGGEPAAGPTGVLSSTARVFVLGVAAVASARGGCTCSNSTGMNEPVLCVRTVRINPYDINTDQLSKQCTGVYW